jgi:multidrug efflux pump subunit AcrA (membrane-fusion protein)
MSRTPVRTEGSAAAAQRRSTGRRAVNAPLMWAAAVRRTGALLGLAWLLAACGEGREAVPTHTVALGEFALTQVETGEVQAASGEQVAAPRIGGQLKILYLYPEGAAVDVGDLVLQFDPADFEKEMLDHEGQLEEAISDYKRTEAECQQRLADLKRNIQRSEAERELAKLNVQRSALDSPSEQERAKIQLEMAARAVDEARQDSVAQEVVNRVDLMGRQHRIDGLRVRYEEAKRDYDRTSVRATRRGIVVHRKIEKRGTDQMAKVVAGDVVWGGIALLEIPDLADMQVLCLVGEMDLDRLAVGQSAAVRLDAFAGPVFAGHVTKLAPMASPQLGAPDIRVFEMTVKLEVEDERLRPGMSSEVEVTVEVRQNALSIPLTALFRVGGEDVVYRRDRGRFVASPVKLGERNSRAVLVEDGLSPGDVVALQRPPESP